MSSTTSAEATRPAKVIPLTPALQAGVIYIAEDRYVCGSLRCAGSSAFHTGVTIPDFRGERHALVPLTGETGAAEVAYWNEHAAPLPLVCECGALQAVLAEPFGVEILPSKRVAS